MFNKGLVLGVLAASVVTFILSGLWYGMIVHDQMIELTKALGMDANDQSMGAMVGYFVAELLRSIFIAYVLVQRPVSGMQAFMRGGTVGILVCAWFGITFLMMPAYTPTLFVLDVLVGGFLFCGISGWIIGTISTKMK